MRTPAAAIAWEFRRHHRWGLFACLAAILILGTIKIAVLTGNVPFPIDELTFALLIPIPLAATFMYLLAVFTFGIAGDLAARESMYPSRMFTLPIKSSALAGWPMLYGCVSMALLWFAIRTTGVFPPALHVPTYWPALFAASLLAWTQALTWMPYPFRGMRIVISIGILLSIDIVVFTALEVNASESTMLLLLTPFLPLAFVTALYAVGRARRGDVPDWRFAYRFAPASSRSTAVRDFRSAARAQLWFEWRHYGRSLPLMVAIVLPVGISLLFLFHDISAIVVEIVVASLLLPSFMAVFVAATAGKSSANASGSYGITPFIATRPVEDRALVLAKWQAALLSALAAWTIVAVVVPLGLVWSGATEPIVDIARHVTSALGPPRAIVLALLVATGLLTSTWKQLVQGLYIAMSGRDWAVKGVAFATLFLFTASFFALAWIGESHARIAMAWSSIPWVMAALVTLKLVLAMPVMQRGVERRAFTPKQLVYAAIVWDLCVFGVYAALAAILPDIVVRHYVLALAAILAVPFVRLAATPAAVARNRHR